MNDNVLVKVHPNVILGIIDAYEHRKHNDGCNDAAMGVLLGSYERNAVRITNCYSMPFDKEEGNTNHAVNAAVLNAHRKAYPYDLVVGWFITNTNFDEDFVNFHEYYTQLAESIRKFRTTPPIILLTVDTTVENMESGLTVRAFTDLKEEQDEDNEETVVRSELKVKFETTAQESSALNMIMKGTISQKREVPLATTDDAEEVMCADLSAHMTDMVDWLKMIKQYVDEQMKKDVSERDHDMGRRLMEIVRTAATVLHPGKLENIIKTSLRDQMLISYLAELAKTNVEIVDRLVHEVV